MLTQLVAGESAENIAGLSFVSLATIRSQIRSILTKLGVKSQLAAVAVAPGLGRAIYLLRRPGVHTVSVRVVPAAMAVVWMMGIWRRKPAEPVPGAAAPAVAAP